jgi:hypothetical protein
MEHRRWIRVYWLVASVLFGCGSGASDGQGAASANAVSSPSPGEAAAWECSMKSSTVLCSAALAQGTTRPMSYACAPNESDATCPDSGALDGVSGLDARLAQSGAADAFRAQPWACLVTGKHQYQCARSLGPAAVTSLAAVGGPGAGAQADSTSGGDSSDSSDSTDSPDSSDSTDSSDSAGSDDGAGGSDGQPQVPSSCDARAWEPWFAGFATHVYQQHGLNISFPRELFDTSQSLGDVAIQGALGAAQAGVSCHDAEWEMRQQAWLTAVMHGCSTLGDAITVMCQQAADYAPTTGACDATGTW